MGIVRRYYHIVPCFVVFTWQDSMISVLLLVENENNFFFQFKFVILVLWNYIHIVHYISVHVDRLLLITTTTKNYLNLRFWYYKKRSFWKKIEQITGTLLTGTLFIYNTRKELFGNYVKNKLCWSRNIIFFCRIH